jgi:cellulose biosynthesis protein BcsQ
MLTKHQDEGRRAAIDALSKFIENNNFIERAMLIDDIFGRFRLMVWAKETDSGKLKENLNAILKESASNYWGGDIWIASDAIGIDKIVFENAWKEAQPSDEKDCLRIMYRYRSRGAWLQGLTEPSWAAPDDGPAIVVFYSFKGGVGRSTALASFAISRARAGETVVVVDFDLDAPGAGLLLAADDKGTTASWGVLDYLLERPYDEVDFRDYYHACRRSSVTGEGEVLVIPAGLMNSDYLGKLARVDFEPPSETEKCHPLLLLLEDIKQDLKPHWILLDGRAGLSDSAGLLLGGLAHLYIIFGTSSEQSWQGLRIVLEKLGAQRVRLDRIQRDCLIVQAMIPEDPTVSRLAKETFFDRARDEFAEYYYAADPTEDSEEDRFWYVRDMEDDDALHVPIPISYHPKFANFSNIDDIANDLVELSDYRLLAERITARFGLDEEKQ